MTPHGQHLGGSPQPRPGKTPPKSLLRNLGEFCGHIAKSVTTPVDVQPTVRADPAKVVREEIQEHHLPTARGTVVLRRRIIDEIEPARETSH